MVEEKRSNEGAEMKRREGGEIEKEMQRNKP